MILLTSKAKFAPPDFGPDSELPVTVKPFTLWLPPVEPATELYFEHHYYVADGRTDVFPFTDDKRLLAARREDSRYPISVYDDGYGPLWISRDFTGISGIVRAHTWEDAYGICEDEFFPEADETIDEIRKEYNVHRRDVRMVHTPTGWREVVESDYPIGEHVATKWELIETPWEEGEDECWVDNELFQEAYGFRPNGPNATDVHKHGIYTKNLNGDYLDRLTPKLAKELGLAFVIETEKDY